MRKKFLRKCPVNGLFSDSAMPGESLGEFSKI